MLRQIVTATASRALAQRLAGKGAGTAGAVIGLALPFVARRLGPVGMIGLAVGAWAVNRYLKADDSPLPSGERATREASGERGSEDQTIDVTPQAPSPRSA